MSACACTHETQPYRDRLIFVHLRSNLPSFLFSFSFARSGDTRGIVWQSSWLAEFQPYNAVVLIICLSLFCSVVVVLSGRSVFADNIIDDETVPMNGVTLSSRTLSTKFRTSLSARASVNVCTMYVNILSKYLVFRNKTDGLDFFFFLLMSILLHRAETILIFVFLFV